MLMNLYLTGFFFFNNKLWNDFLDLSQAREEAQGVMEVTCQGSVASRHINCCNSHGLQGAGDER